MNLLDQSKKLSPWLRQIYQDLHAIPELDFDVHKTAEYIEAQLDEMNIPHKRVSGTGIVAVLKGRQEAPAIAIRADIDALPIHEETGLPFASKEPGKMHACGHDAHTTCLLGLLKLLKDLDLRLPIVALFQPAEETTGGAMPMIEEGALDNPPVEAVLALHTEPNLPCGTVAIPYGKTRAASDMFDIVINGKGGHGAMPHKAIDPIAIGAQIITALQQIASRQTSPTDSAVVTIGYIRAGTARNVIPQELLMQGILRTVDPETRKEHIYSIERIVTDVAKALGANAEIDFYEGYPALINNDSMSDLVTMSAQQLLGQDNVKITTTPDMGVDDFAHLSRAVPGCYFYLGTSDPAGETFHPLHNSKFKICEDSLPIGTATLAQTCLNWMEAQNK